MTFKALVVFNRGVVVAGGGDDNVRTTRDQTLDDFDTNRAFTSSDEQDILMLDSRSRLEGLRLLFEFILRTSSIEKYVGIKLRDENAKTHRSHEQSSLSNSLCFCRFLLPCSFT